MNARVPFLVRADPDLVKHLRALMRALRSGVEGPCASTATPRLWGKG